MHNAFLQSPCFKRLPSSTAIDVKNRAAVALSSRDHIRFSKLPNATILDLVREGLPSISGLIVNKFNAGGGAFIQCQETFDIIDATVTMVPTSKTKKHTLQLQNKSTRNIDPDHICDKNNAPAPRTPSMSLAFFRPE